MNRLASLAALAATAFMAAGALAQEIRIGLTGSFTGPTAALGIPYKRAAELFPAELGGVPVRWIILDDAGDATLAVRNAQKFIDEDNVDAILGSTTPPGATAMFELTARSGTPQLCLAPVAIPKDKQPWIFSIPQPVPLMGSALIDDMKMKGIRTIGYIGFADVWGELWWKALGQLAGPASIKVLTDERYNRNDTSVVAQALKVIAARPDAVLIGASSTPATLPHLALRERGFKGPIYHTHGTINQAFLDLGGKALDGAIMPTGPVIVAEQLPDANPIKKVALDFIQRYEQKWGKGSHNAFAGYSWDGMLLLEAAIPGALKKAKPGTAEFRTALRDQLQSGREVVGTHAVYKHTGEDHYGLDERARVLVTVKDKSFHLYPK